MRKLFVVPSIIIAAFAFGFECIDHIHLNVNDWLQAVVYSLLVGVASGGIFAIVARLAMPFIALGIIRELLGAVGLSLLMVVVTVVATGAALFLPRGSWQQIAKPPERLVSFEMSDAFWFFGGALWAKSVSGKVYVFACQQNECQWRISTLPVDDASTMNNWCRVEDVRREMTPLTLMRVVDRRSTRHCGPDYSMDSHFILVDDGTVWTWQRMNSLDSLYQFAILIPVSLIAGIIGAILTVRATHRKYGI